MPPKGKGRGKSTAKSKAAAKRRQQHEDDDDSTQDKDYSKETSDDDASENSEEASTSTQEQSRKSSKPKKKRRKDGQPTCRPITSTTTTVHGRSNTCTPEPSISNEDPEDSPSDAIQPNQASGGKKTIKRSPPLILDKEIEANLGEWYQGHTLFYDKRHPDHANKTKEEGLIADKARELGLDPLKLATWFKNQRDVLML